MELTSTGSGHLRRPSVQQTVAFTPILVRSLCSIPGWCSYGVHNQLGVPPMPLASNDPFEGAQMRRARTQTFRRRRGTASFDPRGRLRRTGSSTSLGHGIGFNVPPVHIVKRFDDMRAGNQRSDHFTASDVEMVCDHRGRHAQPLVGGINNDPAVAGGQVCAPASRICVQCTASTTKSAAPASATVPAMRLDRMHRPKHQGLRSAAVAKNHLVTSLDHVAGDRLRTVHADHSNFIPSFSSSGTT